MTEVGRRWDADRAVTATVVGVVALAGGAVGFLNGAGQRHFGVGWIVIVVAQTTVGALLAGFVALVLLAVAAAAWSLLVHLARLLVRFRSGVDE